MHMSVIPKSKAPHGASVSDGIDWKANSLSYMIDNDAAQVIESIG